MATIFSCLPRGSLEVVGTYTGIKSAERISLLKLLFLLLLVRFFFRFTIGRLFEPSTEKSFPIRTAGGRAPAEALAGPRGNVTTIRHYTDASNYVSEHFNYDVLGNMVLHTDPLGRETATSYADNFSSSGYNGSKYAYPTSVTNELSQTSQIEYDYNTGLVTETTDVRGQTASTTYDELNRPLTVSTPGGGQTSYEYATTIWLSPRQCW